MEPSKATETVTCVVSAAFATRGLMIIAILSTRRHGMNLRHTADKKMYNDQQDRNNCNERRPLHPTGGMVFAVMFRIDHVDLNLRLSEYS